MVCISAFWFYKNTCIYLSLSLPCVERFFFVVKDWFEGDLDSMADDACPGVPWDSPHAKTCCIRAEDKLRPSNVDVLG